MQWPYKYRAHIMRMLTNRMDPSSVHDTLAANVKFYVPFVHNAPTLKREAVGSAATIASAASAAAAGFAADAASCSGFTEEGEEMDEGGGTDFQATHHTVALLQAWATGMLSGLR